MFRPPRRRRRWIWPVILVALLGSSYLLTSGGDTPVVVVEDLREDLADLSRKSGTFQDVIARMSSIDRVEFVDAADGLIASIISTRSDIVALPPEVEPEFRGVLKSLELTLDMWERGVAGFRDSMLAAADDPAAIGIEEALLDAMLDLRAGDRLYADFVAEATDLAIGVPVSGYPDVKTLPTGFPIVSASSAYAEVARAPGGPLATLPRLVLGAVTTEPEWVQDTSGQVVVAAVEVLTVKVVVANSGNVPSIQREMRMELRSGDGTIEVRTGTVEPLQPGSQTTVAFAELPVRPGAVYQLSIALDAEGAVDDLTRSLTFRVNEATSG